MAKPSYYELKNILDRTKKSGGSGDNLRIIDSYPIYDDEGSQNTPISERPLNYLCYEIESLNPETGEKLHFFKALKFARVIRLPKSAKQSTSLMDIMQQVLSAAYEREFNMVTIIANIIKPVPLGLLYLYGVQGVADNIADAKSIADQSYVGLTSSLQGSFATLEMRDINSQECEWLRTKMFGMEHLTAVRGIPKASKSGEDMGNKGSGGKNLNPDSQGTLEEFIRGMADYEYVVEVLTSSVKMSTLKEWSLSTQKQMTMWHGQHQGTKALSMSISMPMMFSSNQSNSQGWSKAYSSADGISRSQGTSFSNSLSESVSQGVSQTYGQSFGISRGQNISNSVSRSQSVSQSESISQGQTVGSSQSVSTGRSFTQGASFGTGRSFGQAFGQSMGRSVGVSSTAGTSQSINQGQSINQSQSQSANQSFGKSLNQSYGRALSQSVGNSHSIGSSQSIGTSSGTTVGHTSSENASVGENHSLGGGQSENRGLNRGQNWGTSETAGASLSTTEGTSLQKSDGTSENRGFNIGGSAYGISGGLNGSNGSTHSEGISFSLGNGNSLSAGYSKTEGRSYGESLGWGASVNYNDGTSFSHGNSQSNSMSGSFSANQSFGANESYGATVGQSSSENFGTSMGSTESMSLGNSVSKGWGQSIGMSSGVSSSQGYNQGQNIGQSQTINQGLSQNQSQSYSNGYNQSQSQSISNSFSQTHGYSKSVSNGYTEGQSVGQSYTESQGQSISEGVSTTKGLSRGLTQGTSQTTGTSNTQSMSAGTSGAYVAGMGSSMGFGPSVGYNKSYQWKDQEVEDILKLLEFQNERILKTLRGEGAFYTYVYIATPTRDALAAAQAVAKSTWQNEFALVNPVQVLNLGNLEKQRLLYRFSSFSIDPSRERIGNIMQYRYCTPLLPQELVAYTHLPRISEGGIFADVEDIPKFAVPSGLKGEIYMGTILSAERYTMKHGYRTQFDYRIAEEELMHGFFAAGSRSGKTVAAMRFVAELANVRRKKTGKRLRIFCLDPKNDWRTLARFVDPARFRFYSLGNCNFRPIKINPLRVPKWVDPQLWMHVVIDVFCRATGLLERGKITLEQAISELYKECGLFDVVTDRKKDPEWGIKVNELSKRATMADVYRKVLRDKVALEDPTNAKGKAGNNTRDAYEAVLVRLTSFSREYSVEYRLFGTQEGISIDELIGNDDVTVLESAGLEKTFKGFIFGIITAGIYRTARSHENGFLADDQYETVMVIEEANDVLKGNDAAGTGSGGGQISLAGQSEFEEILDQSAGYGLFLFAITQKISEMPRSIVANCGLVFAGRMKIPDDITTVVRSVAREERYDNRDLVKWFPRMPTGWFVCQRSRTFDFKEAEPILVQIHMLNAVQPTNLEIDEILTNHEVQSSLQSAS